MKYSKLQPKIKDITVLKKWAKDGKGSWEKEFEENFARAGTCSKFLFGVREWDISVINQRRAMDKETISANFCNKFYKQLKSELMEVNVSLDVVATTDVQDDEQLLDKEIVEQIVLSSENQNAFKKVLDDCLIYGFGVLEATKKYEENGTTNQILSLRAVKNIQNCFFDLRTSDITLSKGRFAGQCNQVPVSTIQVNYPKIANKVAQTKNWVTGKLVDVWDFYWKESFEEVYYQTKEGWPWIRAKDMNAEQFSHRNDFRKKRRALPMICRARWVEDEFLIKPEVFYAGAHLPLFYWPMLTSRVFSSNTSRSFADTKNANIVTSPYIFPFLGIQQAYNYALSQATTLVAQATGRKYFLTKDQANADQTKWENINSIAGAVYYSKDNNPVSQGQANQPPVQIQVDASEPLPVTLVQFLQLLQSTFNEISGQTAAQQGEQDNTVSGAAAEIKVSQANLTNRQMISTHIAAINEVGNMLQEWIPQVYTERRIYRLPNGKLITINERSYDQMRGEIIHNDINDLMSVLKIKIGSGVSTRLERKTAIQSLINIMGTSQNSLALLGPVLAMNWEGDGKDMLEKMLLTQLSQQQYDLIKGKITPDDYFKQVAESQQPDPKMELENQKLQQQIANITANTQAAQVRAQKAAMDTAFVKKQVQEPMNVEKQPEYAELAKEKQISQIKELKMREQLDNIKLDRMKKGVE